MWQATDLAVAAIGPHLPIYDPGLVGLHRGH
jgi:hypothetical protein